MSKNKKQLTAFLREMMTKSWSEFVEMEADLSHSSHDAVVFSLIRACQKQSLPAIKESLDRIDGKVAVEIEVEYPKFYLRFPYAKSVEGLPPGEVPPETSPPDSTPETEEQEDEGKKDSLRHALNRMSQEPRELVRMILQAAQTIDTVHSYKGDPPSQDPLVKAVIVAGLLKAAHDGEMAAVFEVLDQIDGKVADRVVLAGDDVYINRYDLVAPAGATLNSEGIYELVADNTTNAWAAMLKRENSNERRFGK